MSIKELTQDELHQVSGANLIGNLFIQSGNAINNFLNIPFISSFGHAFSVAGWGVPHGIVDLSGYTASKALTTTGKLLGGTIPESQTHYNHDYLRGDYNLIPKWITNIFSA